MEGLGQIYEERGELELRGVGTQATQEMSLLWRVCEGMVGNERLTSHNKGNSVITPP